MDLATGKLKCGDRIFGSTDIKSNHESEGQVD